MADIPLILPLTQVTVATGGPPVTQAGVGGAGTLPVSLPPPGTEIAGVIVGQNAAGNALLRTDQGTLTLNNTAPLPFNSDVVVRLGTTGTARIVSVGGVPFADYTAQGQAVTEGAEDSVAPGLLAPASQNEMQASALAASPLAGETTLALVTVQATIIAATEGSKVAPGSTVTVEQPREESAPESVFAPEEAAPSPPPSPPSPAPLSVLNATLSATHADGTVTVQTSEGALLQLRPESPALAALPVGSALTLALPAATATTLPLAAAPATLGELAGGWETLKTILQVVESESPATDTAAENIGAPASPAASLLARLPMLGENFTASSVSLLGAMAQNNPRKLLGDATLDSLKRAGRSDLIEKFAAELETMLGSPPTAPHQAPQWQSFFLPFSFEGAVEQARLYVKHEQHAPASPGEDGADDTRFVVEVDMSRLGPLQLDGLVRKSASPGSVGFDLILRARHGLPEAMQQDIEAIYQEAAALTGFKGRLTFQTVTQDFPVKPLGELSEEPGLRFDV